MRDMASRMLFPSMLRVALSLVIAVNVALPAHVDGAPAKRDKASTPRPEATSPEEEESRDWLDYVAGFGLSGLLGTLAGTVVGRRLASKAEREARVEEREHGERERRRAERENRARELDRALADAAGDALDHVREGDAQAGLKRFSVLFDAAFRRYAPHLENEELVTRIDLVRSLVRRGIEEDLEKGTFDYALEAALRRAIANARSSLAAFAEDQPLPRSCFPGPDGLRVLLGEKGQAAPFEALREWVDRNAPPDVARRFERV
jgi:hypothetical protein